MLLQQIRDRVQGWVAGVIIAILVIAFVFWGIQYYLEQGGSNGNPVAVTVNGHKIYSKELSQTYQQVLQRAQSSQKGVPLSAEAQQQLKQLVLQNLVSTVALAEASAKAGFSISMDQVKKMVMADPFFQVNGRFSPEKFQEILYNYNLTPDAFLSQVQSTLLISQVTDGVQNTAFVLPEELKQAYLLFKQERNFKYAIIPASKFIAEAKITEDQIREYYNQNKNEYMEPEKVQVSYIMLTPAELKKDIQVTDSEIKQYYDSQKAENSKIQAFEKEEASIRQSLIEQKLEKLYAQKSEQLTNLTYTNPGTLDVAAKALGLKIQSSPLMTREGEKSGLFAEPKVLSAIFRDDVLHSSNNSDPIELKNGDLLVVRVQKNIPSQAQSLAAVHEKIKEVLAKQAAEGRAGVEAYQIQTQLAAPHHDEEKMQALALNWETKEKVGRGSHAVPNEILFAAFGLREPAAGGGVSVTSTKLSNGDYAVIVLTGIVTQNFEKADTAELKVLQKHLSSLNGQLDYKLYVKSVLDQTHFKVYPKAF
jgi:peptidyl-prolyl cis-trans isomerase D